MQKEYGPNNSNYSQNRRWSVESGGYNIKFRTGISPFPIIINLLYFLSDANVKLYIIGLLISHFLGKPKETQAQH